MKEFIPLDERETYEVTDDVKTKDGELVELFEKKVKLESDVFECLTKYKSVKIKALNSGFIKCVRCGEFEQTYINTKDYSYKNCLCLNCWFKECIGEVK